MTEDRPISELTDEAIRALFQALAEGRVDPLNIATSQVLQAQALCRIADALEKIAKPLDPQPLIEAEREACAAIADTAQRFKGYGQSLPALKDVAQSIRNRAGK